MAYATKKKISNNSTVPLGSNLYGSCSTASGTAQKTVSMPDFDVLVEGVTIHVYFANKNTASSPKLKVGSTSAVAIKRNGSLEGMWENGSVVSFTYDGTNWVQNDADDGGAVNDVRVNGTSVVTDKIANIDPRAFLDIFYPVGTSYETVDANFNPNTAWGGTWVLEQEGLVHVSAGSNYAVGSTGGSATKAYTPDGTIGNTKLTDKHIAHDHSFTQPKIPNHTHTVGSGRSFVTHTSGNATTIGENNVGGGSAYRVPTIQSGDNWYGQTATASSGGGGACTGGDVGALGGGASERTAHGHTWTGTQASINVMQPHKAVNRWIRTA